MEKYTFQKEIGSGSFATVSKALNKENGSIVAIKKMKKKFNTWDECLALREVKCLRKLKHPNIIQMKEAIRANDELFLVFEYITKNIYQQYTQFKSRGEVMPESQIKSIVYQVASGLAHMHKHGFFHRDLKPENMCIDHDNILKLIDFGLAREIRSAPPYTDYVATRWYRAPEIIMKAPNYNSPVDIFALGCIMAELYLMSPIFCGNSEVDQLHKIFSVLGTPNPNQWPQGYKLASQVGISFPQYEGVELKTLLKSASDEALSLLNEMLQIDPSRRPTAAQILNHPFFSNMNERTSNFGNQEHSHVSKSTSPQKYALNSNNRSQQNSIPRNDILLSNIKKPAIVHPNTNNSLNKPPNEESKYNFQLPNSYNQNGIEGIQNNIESKNKNDSLDLFAYNPTFKGPANQMKMANHEAFRYQAKMDELNSKGNNSRFQSNIGNFLGMSNMKDPEEDAGKTYGRHKLY